MSGADRHNLLRIARVLKSNGADGEVVIGFSGYSPEDIKTDEPVFIFFDGLPVPFFINSFTKRGNTKALVRLTDVESSEDAEEITGADVYADADSVAGEHSEDDMSIIEGWDLYDRDENHIGTISEYLDIPGNPCITVARPDGQEVTIPFHEDLIEGIDPESMIVMMDIPEGLLEL